MSRINFKVLAVCLFGMLGIHAFSQISTGGIPPSFNIVTSREAVDQVVLSPPDYQVLRGEDRAVESMGLPERMGVILPSDVSSSSSGTWTDLGGAKRIWRVNIVVDQAVGLGLYFSNFYLAPGDELFVYSQDRKHLVGAFTSMNNKDNKLFATEVVKGESIIIELVENINNDIKSTVTVSDVLVVYTPMEFGELESSMVADPCEVNVNCSEGDSWRDQVNGVIRILVRNGTSAYWCTGALMNNTSLDFSPLVLTADHCAYSKEIYVSDADLARWVFYFKYESRACLDNTPVVPKTMTGAEKLASSSPNGNNGSDFYLMRLFENIPGDYQPYFLGWNANDQLSSSGASIHHPEGDVKKISTYRQALKLSEWGDATDTHLEVIWGRTANGYGVTEGGSSGSPLFNQAGNVIGQLTGGDSSCEDPIAPDLYGRLYYSWVLNGTDDSLRLQPWLDPVNTGLRDMEGSYNTKVAIAQLVADKTVITVGESVDFNDLSVNIPDDWSWTFEGGTPSSSSLNDPGEVIYNGLGSFDVILVVSNEFGQDSVILEDYIKVVPSIYPNPTRNEITIRMGENSGGHEISIINSLGKLIDQFTVFNEEPLIQWSFTTRPAGLYLVRIKSGEDVQFHKLLYTP